MFVLYCSKYGARKCSDKGEGLQNLCCIGTQFNYFIVLPILQTAKICLEIKWKTMSLKMTFEWWKQNDIRGKQFLNNITCFHELSLLGLVQICQHVQILKEMHGWSFNVALFEFIFTLSPELILQFILIFYFLIGLSIRKFDSLNVL